MNHHTVHRAARPFESPEFRSGRIPNLCIRFIILFSLLGIDELVWSATGFRHAGSVALLIPAGILFLHYWPYAIRNRMVLLTTVPVVVYLAFATMYGISRSEDVVLLRTYFFFFILITIVVGHIVRSDKSEVEYILKFSKNMLFISSILVVLSPYYFPYLSNIPERTYFRYSGFFANANDASLCIVIFFLFLLYMPYSRKILNYLGLLVVLTGILITYSKAGIILLIASSILYMLIKYRWRFVSSLMVFVPFLTILFWPSIYFLFDFFVPYMNDSQIHRVEKMLGFMEGGFDSTYTGYRNILWSSGIFIIQENFPHGAGLGAFHHLHGVVFEGDDWQGVHNMYLMIAGEAGFLAFVFFISCYGGLLVFAIFSPGSRLAIAVIFASLLYYGTTHNGFGDRFQIVVLAISIGLMSRRMDTPDPDPSEVSLPSPVSSRLSDFRRPA